MDTQCEVIEPCAHPVIRARDSGRLLKHDVGASGVSPGSALLPFGRVVGCPAKLRQKPVEGWRGRVYIDGPQLDVLHWIEHDAYSTSIYSIREGRS